MPSEQAQLFCVTCQRYVLVQRPVPHHLVHALVTLFTCGGWGIVWLILSLGKSPWRCAYCGGQRFADPQLYQQQQWALWHAQRVPASPPDEQLPEVEPDEFEPPERR
jgi:hypothetical protein